MQGFRPEATRVTVAHQTIALSVICMTSSVMLHQTTAASTKAHGTVAAAVPGLPSGATVGSGWGTNIHWTLETRPGEAAMLAKAYKCVSFLLEPSPRALWVNPPPDATLAVGRSVNIALKCSDCFLVQYHFVTSKRFVSYS